MRVSDEILDFLSSEIRKKTDNCKLYLFGSRVDDSKRGGDIDILILSEKKLRLADKLEIKRNFYKKFGIQKLDMINFLYNEDDAFKNLVLSQPNIAF